MLAFERVTKIFPDGKRAVSNLTFEVARGETLVLLGQSGSGKTTALRLINRLVEPTEGIIYFDGEELHRLDPIQLRRKIGYAIQHIGLFLHMTVAENIGIVPKLLGWKPDLIDQRVDELLEMVGLEPSCFRTLLPRKLSGGQKQRIGVARALAANPPVILMDEPFGALDPIMREQLQNEFLDIQSKINKTVVFVTHDLTEAMKMGDRIAVFEEGKIIQIAPPAQLLEKPANAYIEAFLGKERFHLLLQTKPLHDLIELLEPGDAHAVISHKSSLLDAWITFKTSGSDVLSIFDGSMHIGNLKKQILLEALITSL